MGWVQVGLCWHPTRSLKRIESRDILSREVNVPENGPWVAAYENLKQKKVQLGNRGVVAVAYDNCRLIHRTFHNSNPTDYSWSLTRVVSKRALIIYIQLKLFQRIFNLLKLFFLFYCYVDFPRITAVFSLSQSEGDYLIYRFNKN